MGIGSKFGITAETGNNIQTLGLVGYWDAAYKKSYISGSTSTYNLASGSLTPIGSLIGGTGWTGINPTSSFIFDGVDDKINLGNYKPSVAPDTGLTFNIWLKIGGAAGSRAYGAIISNWSHVADYCWIGTQVNDPVSISVYFDGAQEIIFPDQPFQTWRLMTITHDSTNIIGYINGIQTNTATGTLSSIGTGITSIGYDTNRSNYPFLGEIASLQIYNRALPPAEVLQNYNAQKDRFGL